MVELAPSYTDSNETVSTFPTEAPRLCRGCHQNTVVEGLCDECEEDEYDDYSL